MSNRPPPVIDGYAHLDLSTLLDKAGEHEEAIKHASSALEVFRAFGNTGGIAAACWNLGWFYFHVRDFEKSAAASRNAVDINPSLFGPRFNLGLALLYQGQEQEARKEYEIGADSVSSASELKFWAIDDLTDALGSDSPPTGGKGILEMLKDRHEKLKEVRVKSPSSAITSS